MVEMAQPPVAPARPAADKRIVIFANKHAGALSRDRGKSPFEQYALQAGLEPHIVFTRSASHFRQLLREQVVGKLDRVAIAGGDGTIHNAVQVLAGSGVTLGILPQGTANNFANALRLPMDLPSAFRVISEGEEREVDLGEADGEYFTEAAGVGLFADMLAITHARHDPRTWLPAGIHFLNTILSNRPRRLTVVVDGEPYVEDVLTVTVANSFAVGYNFPIAPFARVTDQQLDVVIINRLDRREVLQYYRAVRAQAHLELPKVRMMKADQVQITARHPMAVHVDDRARKRTPITLRVAPRALKVMVDRL
jgi:diacylglycerol kinase (ATP)